MTRTHHKGQQSMSPVDAFERVCLEIIQLEAIANAAGTAMDQCVPPAVPRSSFDRAHALVGNAADRATAAVELTEKLKASVKTYIAKRR